MPKAAATLILKANDTLPILRVQLVERSVSAAGVVTRTPYVIPALATVEVKIKSTSGVAYTGSVACTVESAASGIINYARTGAENAVPGNYRFEFQVTESGGQIRTFPAEGYLEVTILEDLG